MSKPRTDAPKPPPFPVGTRVRYLGTSRLTCEVEGRELVILAPGLEVTIDRVYPGRRGTGELLDAADQIYDETSDGRSVFYVYCTKDRNFGRIIHARNASEWEVVHGQEG